MLPKQPIRHLPHQGQNQVGLQEAAPVVRVPVHVLVRGVHVLAPGAVDEIAVCRSLTFS